LTVLGALDAAHAKGVLHRDVKPSNILISEQNQVFLVDFGVAQLTDVTRLTSKNTFVGTVEFMAPERIGRGIEAPAGDLWSLGVTLFCALERYSPFRPAEDDNVATTILAIMNSPVPESNRRGPLADVVKMLLRKDPAERMTAADLNHALRSILTSSRGSTSRGSTSRAERPRPVGSPRPARDEARPAPRPGPAGDVGRPPAAGSAASPAKPVEPPGGPAEPPGPMAARPGAQAGQLRDLTPGQAAVTLAGLDPAAARDRLLDADIETAGAVLLAMPAHKAAEILAGSPSRVVATLLAVMVTRPRAAAAILQILSAPRAGRAIGYLSRDEATALLGTMPHIEAARILVETDVRTAAGVIGALRRGFAARVIEAMSIRSACGVLGYVPPATIAALLRATTDGRNEAVLRGLTQPVRAQVLRHL
jgi:eukaryotic-like serine/threonine-protein kinase